jgi:two-component system, LytTR family, response regulator LytT
MKILVLEDEAPAARRITSMIQLLNEQQLFDVELEIIATYPSIQSAREFLETEKHPDLILSDIQLADGLSFELFANINCNAPIIFTTAYDEYAVRAFKLNSIDYLLKPIVQEELTEAIKKFQILQQNNSNSANVDLPNDVRSMFSALLEQKNYRQRYLVESLNNLILIPISEVAYIYSENKLTRIVRTNGNTYFLDTTLEHCEQELDPKMFFRINRQIIINAQSITSIRTHFTGKLILTLTPVFQEEVTVSRERARIFKKWLDG